MKIEVGINEIEIRAVLLDHVREKLGDVNLKIEDIKIEVKSKQNYRSEWETADFRATVSKASA